MQLYYFCLVLSGPNLSITIVGGNADHIILNGSPLTVHVVAMYSNAWVMPESTNISIIGSGVEWDSFLTDDQVDSNDCTWHGIAEGNVTLSKMGSVQLVYVITIDRKTYSSMKAIEVTDIAGEYKYFPEIPKYGSLDLKTLESPVFLYDSCPSFNGHYSYLVLCDCTWIRFN